MRPAPLLRDPNVERARQPALRMRLPGAGTPRPRDAAASSRGHVVGTGCLASTERTHSLHNLQVGGDGAVADARDDEQLPVWETGDDAAAPAVGVRRSRPPLTARIGDVGSGPAPSVCAAGRARPGEAECRCCRSLSPSFRTGRGAPAGQRGPPHERGPSASGVSGSHGKGPSRQTVARVEATLRSSTLRAADRLEQDEAQERPRVRPGGVHGGRSSAARPGLRSAPRTIRGASIASSRTATRPCRSHAEPGPRVA